MRYPVRKVHITQEWGVNPIRYAHLGLLGHNGLDLRIYDDNGVKASKGKLIAPHYGKVIEARFDADGYGWYYKIENDIEGSILGHNTELFLKVGDTVEEGQVIGITGNTGWSTAPHVHWGYYLKPRDRQNGYSGTINQVPLIGENTMSCDEERLSRDHYWNVLKEIADHLLVKLEKESDVDQLPDMVWELITDNREITQENDDLSYELEDCYSNCDDKNTAIKAEINIEGIIMTINELDIDSQGLMNASYKVKKE